MFEDLTTEELLQKLEEMQDQAPMELAQAILSRGQEVVPHLTAILEDTEYWEDTEGKWWMTVHAVKLLGMLGDPQPLPQLIESLILADETENEWVMEDFPTVFGRIGPPAVEPLMEFIRRYQGDNDLWWPRSTAVGGLVSVALRHPEERERVLAFLHGLFVEDEDPEFLGFVASYLLDLNDPSSFPVLEEAFKKELIDETIIDEDDVKRAKSGESQPYTDLYLADLLEFYRPEEVARRRKRWEEERKEEERQKARIREERKRIIAEELRRLEVSMKWSGAETPSLPKKVGRNEPCPCGSGRKFKKCCLPLIEALPPKRILGTGLYATYAYLEGAPPYDPVLVLENLSSKGKFRMK